VKYNRLVLIVLLGFAQSLFADTLSLDKSNFVRGETITVHFSTNVSYQGAAWVGVIPSHIPHGDEVLADANDLSYRYLNQLTSGDLSFIAPIAQGDYDLRLFSGESNASETASVSFKLVLAKGSLTVSNTDLVRGEAVDVQFSSSDHLADNAWIALVPSNTAHGESAENDKYDLSYHYTKGLAAGSLGFNAPLQVGSYDFRWFDEINSGHEITFAPFNVRLAKAALTLASTHFVRNEPMQVNFDIYDYVSDNAWVGLVPSDIAHGLASDADANDLSYKYISGKTQGVLNFNAPSQQGNYDFRLFDALNGYEIAVSSFDIGLARANLSLSKNLFAPAETINLQLDIQDYVANNAWVALVPSATAHGNATETDAVDLSYRYVSQASNNAMTFNAPQSLGQYDLRLFDAINGYEIASVAFSVVETGVEPTPTDPVEPTPTDPFEPTPTDPIEPIPTDPVEPSLSQADIDQATEQGRASCLQDPLSCGIDINSACPIATLSLDLKLHIPVLVYHTLFEDISLWADLLYTPEAGDLVFKVVDYGTITNPVNGRRATYTQADVDAAYLAGQQQCLSAPSACGIGAIYAKL
jgi:hypothetical protein